MVKLRYFGFVALVAALAIGTLGCKKEAAPADTAVTNTSNDAPPGINPMTPTPIPNAPVSGAESLGGGSGGGVGQAAKDKARSLGSPSSINNPDPEDE